MVSTLLNMPGTYCDLKILLFHGINLFEGLIMCLNSALLLGLLCLIGWQQSLVWHNEEWLRITLVYFVQMLLKLLSIYFLCALLHPLFGEACYIFAGSSVPLILEGGELAGFPEKLKANR